jgi:polyhydroxyalkanoate synthase
MATVRGACWASPRVTPSRAIPDDERFADPVWSDWPAWDLIKEQYLLLTHRLQTAVAQTPDLTEHERQVADFWQRVGLNMLAPTNFFWLNPKAINRFLRRKVKVRWLAGKTSCATWMPKTS